MFSSANKAIIICGPTGSGKSDLGMAIARKYSGSIISADSRQIYRKLDIGTAKPSKEDIAEIPHFLVDVIDVTDDFTAADFAENASKSIEQIYASKRIPIIVGGAGLYLEALTEGLVEAPSKDDKLRKQIETRLKNEGSAVLHKELEKLDPERAKSISPNDPVRIIRALEIIELSGGPVGLIRNKRRRRVIDLNYFWIGIDFPRKVLYERIDNRVNSMIELGLLEENQQLISDGLGDAIKKKKIVGYSEIIDALEGNISMVKAISLLKQHSRNYAKRQMTWFRNRANCSWFNPLETNFHDKVFTMIDDNFNEA